jgi:hypothetical protein
MPVTYEAIATQTLSSQSPTITFNSIPQTYTDLRIVFFGYEQEGSTITKRFRLNGDTGTNYNHVTFGATASSRYTQSEASGTGMRIASNQVGDPANLNQLITIDILNYTGSQLKTTIHQVSSMQDVAGAGYVQKGLGLWNSTAAINSIVFMFLNSSNWGASSRVSLYGIKAA